MSLARRVCINDDTLHFSTFQKDLYHDLLVYTEGKGVVTHMGAILCFVVTLFWLLHVSEELSSCVSFSRALLALERGRTHILVHLANGVKQFDFESISSMRLISMLLMTFLRAFVACWLFVSGAMWLAQTRNVEELVLNAVSLIFVFETDELLYKTLAPTKVRTLVREINPLKKSADIFWHKSGLFGILGSTCALGLTMLVVHFFLLTGYQEMQDIKQMMCAGRKDFVIGVNSQSSGIFSAMTAESTDVAHSFEHITREAVRELREISNPLETEDSVYMADFRKFEYEVGQSMYEYAVQSTNCWDSSLLAYVLPQLQQITGVTNGTSCKDFRHHCGQVGSRVLRNVCSQTCGCEDPRAGLFLNGPIEGCPREACQRTPTYQQAIQDFPCQDPSPSELQHMPGWRKYLAEFLDYKTQRFPKWRSLFLKEDQQLHEKGCQALPLTQSIYGFRDDPCFATLVHSSLGSFCPVTCGCQKNMHPDCPVSCRVPANVTN